MVVKQLSSIILVLIIFLLSNTAANEAGNSSTAGEPFNIIIATAKVNNYRPCSHTEIFSDATYCDGKYEVYKVYGSGDPGKFNVNIFEEGFCPTIGWEDQGSRAEAYDALGGFSKIIVYLRYKKVHWTPYGPIDLWSYNEIDFYLATC